MTKPTAMALVFTLTTVGLGMGVAQAQTPTPILKAQGTFNGHYYEVYQYPGFSWDSANSYVQTLDSYDGVQGHLATLTSYDEDYYVDWLRRSAGLGEVWVGGLQPPGRAQDEGWFWANGEGPIPGKNTDPGYSHWLGGEPNDSGGDERYLGIGLGDAFGWNDEGAFGNIAGFVVEYSTLIELPPIDVSDCIDGCTTVPDIQTLTFPSSVPNDVSITVNANGFFDSRVALGTCGTDSLSLFGGDLVIPAYLCGSPNFIVVKTTSEDFTLQRDTVIIENERLAGNDYECYPTDDDPQHRDVVVWQSTDGNMRENDSTAAANYPAYNFEGSAGEFTFDCGTSLGRSRGASYFVIGMHIDFGIDYGSQPNEVFEGFVALTRYKLELLQAALDAAQTPPHPVLKNGDYTKMKEALINAIRLLDRDNYDGALNKVDNFLKFADKAKFGSSSFNYDGEFEMRGDNIAFMLREKIIPYAP
jgi:hypothetical protein